MNKVVRGIGMLIVLLVLWPRLSAGDNLSAKADFAQGNEAYRGGRYEDATAAYQRILSKGYESGALYYNLANSYYKTGEVGKAVLFYERARRLEPRDPEINANLRLALSELTPAAVEKKPLNLWDRLWRGHIRFYSRDEMIIIAVVMMIFLGACHGWVLYGGGKNARKLMLVVGSFLLIFLYGIYYDARSGAGAAVVTQEAAARFEPKEGSTVHFELFPGQSVRIVEKSNGWVKIERFDQRAGWVPQPAVEGI